MNGNTLATPRVLLSNKGVATETEIVIITTVAIIVVFSINIPFNANIEKSDNVKNPSAPMREREAINVTLGCH